jgi:hypothetical protein
MTKKRFTESKDRERDKTATPLIKDLFKNSEEKKHFGMSPNQSFKIRTAKDRMTREDDEVCKICSGPIIAFEESTGDLFCEKCIFEGRA